MPCGWYQQAARDRPDDAVARLAFSDGPAAPGGATGAGLVEGQRDLQGGARSRRAVQPEAATERLGPVPEPEQAGALAEAGAAPAVVAYPDVQDAVAFGCLDVGGGGAGVLGGVGQCLGDGVVRGDLDPFG